HLGSNAHVSPAGIGPAVASIGAGGTGVRSARCEVIRPVCPRRTSRPVERCQMRSTSTPADHKVHDILVRIIETMHDESQRELARDLLLTLPAVRDWPHDTLRA